MLIARAPVRISLAGGGTDLPAYYEQFGGVVLNTTIDKYFYVFLNVCAADSLQITSSDFRTFYRHDGGEPLLWDGDLSLPRAVLSHFGIRSGVSVFLASEIPPGTGLGSSSTVTVALIKALSTALGRRLDNGDVAELACTIELGKLGQPIGKQDQYAAAFGGLNWIEFDRSGARVEPLRLPTAVLHRLERGLMLFFTGSSRSASQILARQTESSRRQDPAVIDALHRVKAMAGEVRRCLRARRRAGLRRAAARELGAEEALRPGHLQPGHRRGLCPGARRPAPWAARSPARAAAASCCCTASRPTRTPSPGRWKPAACAAWSSTSIGWARAS